MRKFIMLAAVMFIVAGCSGGNEAAQQAEIEKLRAEAAKATAEAAALKRQNDLYEGDTAQLQAKAARDRAATEAMDAAREKGAADARQRTIENVKNGGEIFTYD